jgi:predicted GNAT family N-acyltransferase
MAIKYVEKKPSAEEFNKLRISVGWDTYSIKDTTCAIKNTLYFIIVRTENDIIGMGRITGDNKINFYISDIIVSPNYQKRGIGKKIMKYIMKYINKNAINKSCINLNASIGVDKFYEQFGFWKRPTQKYGYGMSQFINKNQK